MARTIPIRRSLLLNLTLVVLVLGASISAMMALSARRAVRRLSSSIIEQASRRTEVKLDGLFGAVSRQVVALRGWGRAGLLDVEDPEALEVSLRPLLQEFAWSSAVIVADDMGREFLLRREEDGWSSRQTRRQEWGDRVRWREWRGEAVEPVIREESTEYDPRQRPWFQEAVRQLEKQSESVATGAPIHWTEPYFFFSSGKPGMTASSAFPCFEDHLCVVGIDVMLLEISRFTAGIRILDDGVVFVLTEDGRMIGVPRGERGSAGEMDFEPFLLKRPEELGTQTAEDAARILIGDQGKWRQPVRLVSDREPWWGQIVPYELPPQRLLIGVAVKEKDLLGDLSRQRLWIIAITLLALAWAVWRAAALARGYSRPMEKLVEESERIATGNLERGPLIRTRIAEIQRLADAHDRMRGGLKTLLKLEGDLEIARKIQQETLPKTLPRLQGYEIAAWNEPADETGGDSFDVIGLRFSGESPKPELTSEDAETAVLLLADATGHGIGPALSVTQLRAMLRMAVRLSTDLTGIAREMNEQLCADLPRARFITAWLGYLDTRNHTLTTFSAGQAPLLHYRAAADAVDQPEVQAPPFGLFPGIRAKPSATLGMESGDIYAAISDGIFEAFGDTDEEFGTDRVIETLRRHHTLPADEILEAIREATDEFTGGAAFSDDRTILLIKRI